MDFFGLYRSARPSRALCCFHSRGSIDDEGIIVTLEKYAPEELALRRLRRCLKSVHFEHAAASAVFKFNLHVLLQLVVLATQTSI